MNQPATIDELERAYPKAGPDFILSQIRAKATLSEAAVAYVEKLEADRERLLRQLQSSEPLQHQSPSVAMPMTTAQMTPSPFTSGRIHQQTGANHEPIGTDQSA